jgi:outer membrane protein assembly factor BamB
MIYLIANSRDKTLMQNSVQLIYSVIIIGIFTFGNFLKQTQAADQPQWGQHQSRNMISTETGLPSMFDLKTGQNIKWSVDLGDNAYCTPVVAGGKVFIGANNSIQRDPRHRGDRGVLLCLNEADGNLCWQLVVPRIDEGDIYKDWPRVGLCSPPTIDGNHIYTLTNRFELVCLDIYGQANGNDGPYQNETRHFSPSDDSYMETSKLDADILWLLDMRSDIGIYSHDSAISSVLLDGPNLYLNTCNGVDNTHRKIRRPDAPSLIVVEKSTGRLLAQDNEHIGPNIFHSTWSSPAMGEINGRKQIFFCGGNGMCYGFAALSNKRSDNIVQSLQQIWRFDFDPLAPKQNVHRYIGNRRESPSNVKSMPVFYNNRLYVTGGGDIWWGKNNAWLKCIDATQTGDITETGELWSYPLERHCCSTPSIFDGLVFVADCGGNVHCLDAETGKSYWTHKMQGEVWGSTLVADSKVYVGSRRGDFCILAVQKEKQLLARTQFDAPISSTPVAANGVLYVATQEKLFALEHQK